MTEDPTRALPVDPQAPRHGRVGPADPSADPATQPGLKPVPTSGRPVDYPTVPTPGLPSGKVVDSGEPEPRVPAVKRSRFGVLWIGVILSALVLIFLLIFILQNNVPVQINFLGLSGTLPTGVALLFAAIAGLLLGAIPGSLRILQLRRAARRSTSH